MAPLLAPMLARSGRLPTEGGYGFELKWDGFRAILRTGREFRVRSCRGWRVSRAQGLSTTRAKIWAAACEALSRYGIEVIESGCK